MKVLVNNGVLDLKRGLGFEKGSWIRKGSCRSRPYRRRRKQRGGSGGGGSPPQHSQLGPSWIRIRIRTDLASLGPRFARRRPILKKSQISDGRLPPEDVSVWLENL